MEHSYLDLAKAGYQAYGDKANWKNMPTWDNLPENIKTCWITATEKLC